MRMVFYFLFLWVTLPVFLFPLHVLGVPTALPQKTCIVSDIDDTLRMSHVKGHWFERFLNAFKFDAFWGIPEIMNQVRAQGQAEVFYVSNAPKLWMSYSHQRFLEENGFSDGPMILRDGPTVTHKLKWIRTILDTQNCTDVIFFGDNADQDPLIYALIRQQYRHVKIRTYIHQIYPYQNESNRRRDYQVGYLTALDLSLRLAEDGLLKPHRLEVVLQALYDQSTAKPELLNSWKLMLPDWFEGTRWQPSLPTPFRFDEFRRLVLSHFKEEQNSCQKLIGK
jgi:hypothetical protein